MSKHKIVFIQIILFFIWINHHAFSQIKTLNGVDLSTNKIDSFIKAQMDSLQLPGLSIAIIENQKIVYYRALGLKNTETKDSVDKNTLFEAASMTKPVFAYAVIKLANKHIIDLDTPLYKYYPYSYVNNDERYKLITARMCLSHTTGFPNWRSGNDLTINTNPGTKYSYSGEGIEYLGIVIQHKIGKPLQDIIQDEVFTPLNIQHAYFIENDYLKEHMASGHTNNKVTGRSYLKYPQMAYGLHIEAKEYAKFVIALMQEINMPNSTFKTMSVPQIEIVHGKSICLGIFMQQTPFGIKYKHGGDNGDQFHCDFEFYKDLKVGYVYFTNCERKPEFLKRLNSYLTNGK